MKIISGSRQSGKTHYAILLAYRKKAVIVCADDNIRFQTRNLAAKLGVPIPSPITINDLLNKQKEFRSRTVIIDDAEAVLHQLFGHFAIAATISHDIRMPDNERIKSIEIGREGESLVVLGDFEHVLSELKLIAEQELRRADIEWHKQRQKDDHNKSLPMEKSKRLRGFIQ